MMDQNILYTLSQYSDILLCIMPHNFANITFLLGFPVGVLLFFFSKFIKDSKRRKFFWLLPLLTYLICEIAAKICDYIESFMAIMPILIGSIALSSTIATLLCIELTRLLHKVFKK